MASQRSARSRIVNTDEKIYRATLDLLRMEGLRAVSIEAVSARSGVAKTTIYRRAKDSSHLLKAALEYFVPQFRLDDIDPTDPRRALGQLLDAQKLIVRDYLGMSVVSVSPEGALHDEILRAVFKPRLQQLTDWLEMWQRQGLVKKDLDVEFAVTTIIASTISAYMLYQEFPDGWTERFLDYFWSVTEPR